MRVKLFFIAAALVAVVGGVRAGPMELGPKEMASPPTITESEPWHFDIGLPGWFAYVSGDIGLHGITSHVDVGFDKLLKHIAGIATISVEARKGRFGAYADFLYMSLVADATNDGLISKVQIGVDQYLVDGEVYYRVLEGPRGSLDLRAGARYTNLYNKLQVFANSSLIGQAATDFVNTSPGNVNALLESKLQRLLDDRDPTLPIAPVAFGEKAKLVGLILAAKQGPNPQQRIAQILNRELNSVFRLSEQWVDPYIGIGGRYNINKPFYLTGKVDVGGFGAGSEITVQASAALGCQLTRRIYSELGYRVLYYDYDSGGFLYKVTTQGVQLTTGIVF